MAGKLVLYRDSLPVKQTCIQDQRQSPPYTLSINFSLLSRSPDKLLYLILVPAVTQFNLLFLLCIHSFTSAFHIAEPCSYWNLTLCPNLLLLRETTCCRLMNSLFAFSLNLDKDAIARRTTYQAGAAALRPRADLFYLRQMRVRFLPVLVLVCLQTS